MCEFLSGLTFGPKLENKFGRFYSDPAHTDSHTELETNLKLSDRHEDPHWAKWEFTPGPKGITDFDGYQFRLDENRIPSWWDEDLESETIAYAKSRLAEAILCEGKIDELDRDVYALAGSVVVAKLNASVREMRESSQVGEMWGSSQVGEMRGSSQVGEMRGSSQVGEMREYSQVGVMREYSQVGEMRESSQVGVMWGYSQVVAYTENVAKHLTLKDYACLIDRTLGMPKLVTAETLREKA